MPTPPSLFHILLAGPASVLFVLLEILACRALHGGRPVLVEVVR